MFSLTNACLKKVALKTEAEAVKCLRYSRHSGILRAYRCQACSRWHIGHVRSRRRR